jgi:predicted dehydrogenase
VEKPLFDKYKKIPPNKFKEVYVGYNLRFHPIIHKLIDILVKEAIISCSVYVGKYLPFWRPKTDYKKSYSAKKNLGGGVLRDLSHELDYLNLLLGGFRRVTAIGGHFSNLNIETDDVFSLLAETKKCPVVNLEMNYVDRLGRRQILINTDRHTYKADFFNNELYVDEKLLKKFSLSRNYTYERQHKAVLGSSNKEKKLLCSLTKGLEVMRLIVALEAAAKKSKWIKL